MHKVLMYLDKSIGRLVDYLESEGWMDNSIVVVASDNGGCLNSGGSNFPLRGVKESYWEGGNKVNDSDGAAVDVLEGKKKIVSFVCNCYCVRVR